MVLSASAACGPQPSGALSAPGNTTGTGVRFVYLPADPPPPGAYRAPSGPTPAVARCALRDDAGASRCLLETHDEAAIPALLVLGVTNELPTGSEITPFKDAVSASVYAGQLAAATSSRELVAMLADPGVSTESFALSALSHLLVAQGARGALADSASGAVAACLPFLTSPDARVAVTAVACLDASRAETLAEPLARAFVAHPSADVKAAAATLLSKLPRAPVEQATLEGMAAFLHTPLTPKWTFPEVQAREMACVVFSQRARGAPWAAEGARVAAEAMQRRGGSNGQNSPPSCATFSQRK